MSSISKPNVFSASTTISSSEVNDNFDTIYNDYNGNISSVNLADNAVTTAKITDGSVTTAKLADAAVTAAKISGESWSDWTPTLTSLSGGTLTYAKYIQLGKTVHYRLKYAFAGANISGTVVISAPVTAVAAYGSADSKTPCGEAVYYDANGGWRTGGVYFSSSTTELIPFAHSTAASYVGLSSLSSTVPFTWASGDSLNISGTYEAA